MEQFTFAFKTKRLSGFFQKSIVELNEFFTEQQTLDFFLFKLLVKLWLDYNAKFYIF